MAGSSLKQPLLVLTKTNNELATEFQLVDDFNGVAALLALTPSQLYHYTHSGQRYYTFTIAKKHGGTRTIQAPQVGLKLAQRKLNQVLQAVYSPKSVVHGFVAGRNVVSNAALHARKRFILNLDLEKFFGTITFSRVRGMFMAKPYSKNPTVATILARLCCCDGMLAQGSPTSPVVSNMIVGRMDSQLKALARANQCTYSRYADDLTFSTFQKQFPRSLAFFDEGDVGGCLKIGTLLSDVINSNGFQINAAKTRLQHFSGRQVVTGLTANRFPNLSQEFVRQIRAMLFAWRKFGAANAAKDFFEQHDYRKRRVYAPQEQFVRVVKGKIDYLGMVRSRDSRAYLSLLSEYASLVPSYRWPDDLPPRELSLPVLEAAVFAVDGDTQEGTAFNLAGFGLLTCAHVVAGQKNIAVFRHGATTKSKVEVIAQDDDIDLALLKFSGDPPIPLPRIEISKAEAQKLDQIVMLAYPSAAPGVSAVVEWGAITGHYVRFGQPRASISNTIFQGNSGGPVLDRNYRLIGIASNGVAKGSNTSEYQSGVIPIAVIRDFLNKLAELSPVVNAGS